MRVKLIVQSAQHAFLRLRVVILNKLHFPPYCFIKYFTAEALKEKTARIAENTRLKNQHFRDICLNNIHNISARLLAQNFCYHARHALAPVRQRHAKYTLEFLIRQP